jgi:hypothetical protein
MLIMQAEAVSRALTGLRKVLITFLVVVVGLSILVLIAIPVDRRLINEAVSPAGTFSASTEWIIGGDLSRTDVSIWDRRVVRPFGLGADSGLVLHANGALRTRLTWLDESTLQVAYDGVVTPSLGKNDGSVTLRSCEWRGVALIFLETGIPSPNRPDKYPDDDRCCLVN